MLLEEKYRHKYVWKSGDYFFGYSPDGDFSGCTLEFAYNNFEVQFTPWGNSNWADYFSDEEGWQFKILDLEIPFFLRIFGLEISY